MEKKAAAILLVSGVVITLGALHLKRKTPNEKQSNFRGGVRLYPTAPISPSATIEAVQYIGADGAATPVSAPTVSAPIVSAPVAPVASVTPTSTQTIEPTVTPPITTSTEGSGHHGGGHHDGKHKRSIINIYGGYGYPYGWYNYPYWVNPYGNEKSVYCMTEFRTLTQVDGCGALENADDCCNRKSRRGTVSAKKRK